MFIEKYKNSSIWKRLLTAFWGLLDANVFKRLAEIRDKQADMQHNAPTHVTANQELNGLSVWLSWDEVPDAEIYNVYRIEQVNGESVASLYSTVFEAGCLLELESGSYVFAVSAVVNGVESLKTPVVFTVEAVLDPFDSAVDLGGIDSNGYASDGWLTLESDETAHYYKFTAILEVIGGADSHVLISYQTGTSLKVTLYNSSKHSIRLTPVTTPTSLALVDLRLATDYYFIKIARQPEEDTTVATYTLNIQLQYE
jgi:hypothetical protein